VRAAYAAWNAGDMDALGALYDPDVIMRGVEDWPEPGPFVGAEAVRLQWERLRGAWDVQSVEPISDFTHAGDRVAVRHQWHAAGQGPAANIEQTGIFTVRKGKIIAMDFFWDHAEALETVGLAGK
jgi:ketosteroid isomerase-like protein